ncbi:NUDIX domain-containing protein [Actinoplanes sp. TFC3]|uniref:NUDIX domain-containing protein n=1 Tax=Actinoplanes sp. TFC3 TaxID=1710355 RepID=UPI0008345E56|nr:NUDIX domain-containing protein [Actinoplanes sp. TFC3]
MGRTEYWNDPAAPKPNTLVPACGTLAVDHLGRLLMQRRRDTGQWALPMGKMEFGETPSQCAIRETLEETGISVRIIGLVGIYSDPLHIVAYSDGEVRQEYEVTLLAEPVSGSPTENEEASEVGWFTLGEIERLDVHDSMRRQISDYISGAMPHID